MAATRVFLDSGPLVGFLSQTDQHHGWASEVWNSLYDPLWTCEAVLSEAIFLMYSGGVAIGPLLELFERGLVRIDFDVSSQRADLWRLLRKYAGQPMSLADACLVRMAELSEGCQVFTTDRDFLVYRRKGRSVIPLLAPF
ncbi:MAG TPA: PIN domain-containing protein [Candidatus Baltobacteraceae bacterium]|jgi:predicted nucleic acid-binding protein|nr:PIN domain-containing protein [Candidatus Baltobacteraceae bacterium]